MMQSNGRKFERFRTAWGAVLKQQADRICDGIMAFVTECGELERGVEEDIKRTKKEKETPGGGAVNGRAEGGSEGEGRRDRSGGGFGGVRLCPGSFRMMS